MLCNYFANVTANNPKSSDDDGHGRNITRVHVDGKLALTKTSRE